MSDKFKKFKFDFEKLEVYQKSLKFTNDVFSTTSAFEKIIQYSLGDQFRRAALSICNNLAEGSGKEGKSRKQFYNYALNSARECVPMIELAVMQDQISAEKGQEFRDVCIHICNMISKLIKNST